MREGLAVAGRPGTLVAALAFSALAWAASTGTFLAAGQAVGVELSLAQAALLTSGVALVTIIPSGPGYVGTFELTVVAIAEGFGIPRDDAFALGLLVHLMILATTSIGGVIALLAVRRRRGSRGGRSRGGGRPAPATRADPGRLTMSDEFPHVFEPIRLRHKTLTSRITFGAHTANMAEGGLPGERHIGYYRERALGGAAMIVVEPVPVHRTAVLTRGNFRHDDDSIIPAFRRLTDACRAASPDIVMIHQLYHIGQHSDADNSFAPNWSPSGLPSYHDADGSHAVSAAEIEELIEGFVAAAGRAQASGFDGIEVFAGYNALVDQFWAPWSNRRTDEWGGSFENRMRFSSEILRRIRERCGEDFIVGLAISADPESEAYPSIAELAEIVAWHDERRLMDYVTCGTGSYFHFEAIIPTSLFDARLGEPFAAALKAVVRHALVQAESHIRTPAAAEAVLAAGHADMVSIVRGQIADPHLVAKARAGRADEVRPCISCNQLCWGRRSRDYWISCLINPSAGREWEWGGDRFEAASDPRRVLVVGGGPAGLEAARVAAERGHRVTLARARPGPGRPVPAGRPPAVARPDHGPDRVVRTAARDARRGGQARDDGHGRPGRRDGRRRGDRGDRVAAGARRGSSGRCRWSTGSPAWTGRTCSRSTTCSTARPSAGRRILVLDDVNDWRGLGTAVHLAETGHEVTIVDGGSRRRRRPLPQRGRRPVAPALRGGRRPVGDQHGRHRLARGRRDRRARR